MLLVALVSKLMTAMILHQRTSLKSKRNSKGTEKKLMRYGNERALYALVRKKSSELFHVFSELHKRVCVGYEKYRYLTCFVSYWISQDHTHSIDKQGFKVSLRPW